MRRAGLLGAVSVGLFGAAQAQAKVVSITLSGHITDIGVLHANILTHPASLDTFSVGDSFSYKIQFDDALATDTGMWCCGNPARSYSLPNANVNVQLGSYSISYDTTGFASLWNNVAPHARGNDEEALSFSLYHSTPVALPTPSIGGVDYEILDFDGRDSTGEAIPTHNIADFASPAAFPDYTLTYIFARNTWGQVNLNGAVDSVTFSAAPEPTTWAMMILGVAAVGIALRRRVAPYRVVIRCS